MLIVLLLISQPPASSHTLLCFSSPSLPLPQTQIPGSDPAGRLWSACWFCNSAWKWCVRSRQRCASTSSFVLASPGYPEGRSDGNWYGSRSKRNTERTWFCLLKQDITGRIEVKRIQLIEVSQWSEFSLAPAWTDGLILCSTICG